MLRWTPAIIAIFMVIMAILNSEAFSEDLGAKAYLFNKPVLCGSTMQEAMDMLSQVKADGMKPLMWFMGNSFNGDQTKFMSDIFILYDPTDEQVTIVERQYNGFTCILSGGTGYIEFSTEEIEDIIGWNDIP